LGAGGSEHKSQPISLLSQSQLATNWQPESHFLGDAEKSAGIKKSNHR
jgi:hypothetical protein